MTQSTPRTRGDLMVTVVGTMMLAVLLAGFGRSFFFLPLFGTSPPTAATEPIFYLHGAVFASWYVLLVAQVALVQQRNVRLHRRLGLVGLGLAVVIVLLGVYASLVAANRLPSGFIGVPFPPQQFLIVPISDLVFFAAFVALAYAARTDRASHKRYMLLASLALLEAAMIRIPLTFGWDGLNFEIYLTLFILAVMLAWDIVTLRRPHLVTLIGGGAWIAFMYARLPLGETAAWQAFAAWAMPLVR